jgi:superfamily II DNA or RNA helicase
MAEEGELSPGHVLSGPQFDEPMRIETVSQIKAGTWSVGLVGINSERFRKVTLTQEQLGALTIVSKTLTYTGDANLVKLGLQAAALGIAYEYDPFFGLSISRVDPLPHQLEAVYDYLLKVPMVRFLLADDAGAGKTIMAGLLLRELKLRGLAERILIVCPANLTFQWQRELREKFDEEFEVLRGSQIHSQFGMNQWMKHKQVLTSLDLAKRTEILPGLSQVHWDLVIIDEAHRMSASREDMKSQRYKLGELLRDSTDHILLMTATPHKGDAENFSLFLRLLDEDAFANVKSIKEAMNERRAPFYLRRTKEAMVYFPKRQPDGSWAAEKIFKKRIPKTVRFQLDGEEDELYRDVTKFVKSQSRIAAEKGDDPRARAIGFLMSLYQRRLASSTASLRCSLENRTKRLQKRLTDAEEMSRNGPIEIPSPEELEEMEDEERESLERQIEAQSLARNPQDAQAEIGELKNLITAAKAVEEKGDEAKLARLKKLLKEEGFHNDPEQRLLIFTEFKDTLDYLVKCLESLGFKVGYIHGGMKPGRRDEHGTRLFVEQQFRNGVRQGGIQILVATEAAGEGINLQCCHIMVNYDIPWNPNRLEQRMGRIHRYGQMHDCLIFNFVAANTVEGHVLEKLLERINTIRNALDDDSVFNVVGEVLPATYIERVLRDYYAGKLSQDELDDQLLRDVEEGKFRAICQNALEGLASKKLNLEMLVERKARAQERRVVPETIARFLVNSAGVARFELKPVRSYAHTYDPSTTPPRLKEYSSRNDWRLPEIVHRYPRFTTDRKAAEENNLEWVTPGHPLFEALRRHSVDIGREPMSQGCTCYALGEERPCRLDIYKAKVVDGLGKTVHERIFVTRIEVGSDPRLVGPDILGNLLPAPTPIELPPVADAPEAIEWLHAHALDPFLAEIRAERVDEVKRIQKHVEISLTELIAKEDALIGRFAEEAERGTEGAAGNLKLAEDRCASLSARRDKRRRELERQRALTLQGIERVTSVLVLPHPGQDSPDIANLRPDPEVEAIAMRIAQEYEEENGRTVTDVHREDKGYDITGLDTNSGELRLIEVKGFTAKDAAITVTPNEYRVAQDRRDCYWLYVVTNCKTAPRLITVKDPAQFKWLPVSKIEHFTRKVSELPDVRE